MSLGRIKKTYGLVLSEANSGDYDKVLTILTPGLGKITAFAKGARRPKSILLGPCQVFSFSKFVIYQGRNMYYVNSASIVDIFYDIRFNYSKMEIAFKMLKILKSVSPENYSVYEYFKLGIFAFNTLSKTDKDPEFILSIFKARILFETGYAISLKESMRLNKEKEKGKGKDKDKNNKEKLKFAIYNKNEEILIEYRNETGEEKTKIYNEIKQNKNSNLKILSINIFSAINHIYRSEVEKIFNFNLKKEDEEEFYSLIEELFKKYLNIKI